MEINFERTALYIEVWKEAVTKVARRYGLSDVGLRKICERLDVPLPPRGYWAKLAAGKKVLQAPLLPTKYASSYRYVGWAGPRDEELEKRLSQVAKSSPVPGGEVAVQLRDSVDDCHVLVRKMRAKLKNTYADRRGWPSLTGSGVFAMSVSPEQ